MVTNFIKVSQIFFKTFIFKASATAQKLENSAVNGEVCTVCTEVLISTKALLSQNLTDVQIISFNYNRKKYCLIIY